MIEVMSSRERVMRIGSREGWIGGEGLGVKGESEREGERLS